MTEIIFHNRTTKIESCTITKEGKKHHFEGEQAKKLCTMAADARSNSLKEFVDNLK